MMWGRIALVAVSLLPKLIQLMERKHPAPGQGASKRQEVREIVLLSVEAIEGIAGRDIFNDPEVAKLYDAANDALVSLANVLTKKAAAVAQPAA